MGCSSSATKVESSPQEPSKQVSTNKRAKPAVKSPAAPVKTVKTVEESEEEPDKDKLIAQTKVDEPVPAGQKIECRKNNDVRSLTKVVSTDRSSCRVVYRKFNQSRVAGESQFGTSYCDKVIINIKTNLEEAGYTCQ